MSATRQILSGSLVTLLAVAATTAAAFAQQRPEPMAPVLKPLDRNTLRSSGPQPVVGRSVATRREVSDEPVILVIDDKSVDQTFELIMQLTGKVVIPMRPQQLKAQKITVIHDEPIPQSEALDMLFAAFRLNDIGVVEKDDRVIIGQIQEIIQGIDLEVLRPDDPVLGRQDLGNFVVKIYRLEKTDAATIGEHLSESLPDYARLVTDANSNQIVLTADVGLCQHIQRLINELDQTYLKVRTKTYRLKYADASEIASNIEELFDVDATSGAAQATRRSSTNRRTAGRNQARGQQATTATTGSPGPVVEMKLTVNTQQNTVTVQADPAIIEEIDRLIDEFWDLPRPEGTSKLYNLRFTDPLKVRDMLQELLEQGGGGGGGGSRRARGASGGGGGRSAVNEIVGGIYRIEAFPDNNSLLVLCKTEESFGYLDSIITSLDQPTDVGLPIVVELKHANAIQLADEINVLLSMAGTNMTLDRPDAGLSGQGMDSGDSGGTSGATGREAEEGGDIRFPWQAGGRQREDQSPETPLIGKTRIVPIVRQNALAILAPPHYQEHVREIIQYLDRPGRQVMISAIIAEVELNDDFAFGIRYSADSIPLTNIDYSIGGGVSLDGGKTDFLGIFDTSALDVSLNMNVLLQALAQKTNVQILQEPRVFTADNQEAVFFDGQDIPFITDSFTNTAGGNFTQSFEYRQVGVVLNVRPRITAERDVEMEIYLELSSIVPGQTLFGGAIVDRRSTTSQVTIKDGQTIVLSGILRDTESDIERKVPILGDIPILGWFFKSVERANVTTELVAFITPLVVDNPSDNDSNFNADERDRLEELRGLDLKKQQDDVRKHLRDRVYTLPGDRVFIPDEDSQVEAGTDGKGAGTLTSGSKP